MRRENGERVRVKREGGRGVKAGDPLASVERERLGVEGLTLKSIGHPGDRPSQQIITSTISCVSLCVHMYVLSSTHNTYFRLGPHKNRLHESTGLSPKFLNTIGPFRKTILE